MKAISIGVPLEHFRNKIIETSQVESQTVHKPICIMSNTQAVRDSVLFGKIVFFTVDLAY